MRTRKAVLTLVVVAFVVGCLEGWDADVRAWSVTVVATCPNFYRAGHEHEYDQCVP